MLYSALFYTEKLLNWLETEHHFGIKLCLGEQAVCSYVYCFSEEKETIAIITKI